VEKKVEKKAVVLAMKKTTKQVMKTKQVIGKFAKAILQKAHEPAEAKLAMKGPAGKGKKVAEAELKKQTKPVAAAKAKLLSMKAVTKAAVKAKLTAMKGKVAPAKKAKDQEESSSEEEEQPKKTKATPKAKAAAAGKGVVIGKFAKAVQQKGKTAKDVKESAAATKAKAGKGKTPVVSEKTVVANRKEDLGKMYVADLKELAQHKGLEKGTKEEMVKGILALEAKARDEVRAREEKVKQVEKKIKEDLKAKNLSDLKDLCRSKSLPIGGSKDDLVARCLAAAKKEGEVEKSLNNMAAESRRSELLGLDKDKLLALCKKVGVDPLVKEVMVERIVSQESVKR